MTDSEKPVSIDDLRKALEQKAKTEEQIWYDYEKEVVPKIPNPLVSPHIPKSVRQRASHKWVPIRDVQTLFSVFQTKLQTLLSDFGDLSEYNNDDVIDLVNGLKMLFEAGLERPPLEKETATK